MSHASEGDVPASIGAPAWRADTAAGSTQLAQLASVREAELLRRHGGPKVLRLLREPSLPRAWSLLRRSADRGIGTDNGQLSMVGAEWKVRDMAKLIYSMIQSLDGYTEDEQGNFGWGAPEDAAVHTYINELASSVGIYLYGRRMYETMVYWETAHTIPDQPQFVLDWARQWQAVEKVVYSRTLAEPRSARTRLERAFDPDAIRQLKASATYDMTVNGPELAAQALRAALVDEIQMIVCPVVVGGGKRFFPDGVRLDLKLLEERRFDTGVVVLRYAVAGARHDLVFTRVFDAPVEELWRAWTDPAYVKQWWGPNGFTAPVAELDVREGGTSLVAMSAPEFGTNYSTWQYLEVRPHERLVYVHNLADEGGHKTDSVSLGMPPDFPQDQTHTIRFRALGPNQSELTVIEHGWTEGQMMELSRLGMEQCLDKMAALFR